MVASANFLICSSSAHSGWPTSDVRRDEIGSAVDRPVMGTCSYLAPECLTSAFRPDIRSDIYSLGVVLFELLSGTLPYLAKNLTELASLHRQTPPQELIRLAPHVPREVAQLVRRMTAKDPFRRPQSPRELVDRLVALEVAMLPELVRSAEQIHFSAT